VRGDCACDFDTGHLAANDQNLGPRSISFPEEALQVAILTAVDDWDLVIPAAHIGHCWLAKETGSY
jgi:hypothetical protein